MVNFIVQRVSAGINKGVVYTDNPRLKRVLERLLEDAELIGPSDGDRDWAYAKLFVERFGGRIVKGDEPLVDPNLVY